MKTAPVFEETYQRYQEQLSQAQLQAIAPRLGLHLENDRLLLPMLGTCYRVSGTEIVNESDTKPTFVEMVILARYLLLCPSVQPEPGPWAAFRDFKDSGPLTVYFQQDVERKIAAAFSGRREALAQAVAFLGGYAPDMQPAFDLARQFDFLPHLPMLMLFNDADDEFPANCRLLFRRSAEVYLDAECLAMSGNYVALRLITMADNAQ